MMADPESTDKIGGMDVVWYTDEHSLGEIVDEFNLPVLVKVADGFMINEQECLDYGTILTIHGQRCVEKIAATDQHDQDMRIPLDCKHKVIVWPYSEVKVYNTVREICEETRLPRCIQNNREFKFRGESFKVGTTLIVKSIFFEREVPKGLSVMSAEDEARRVTLPLAVRGDFMQVQLPKDRNRLYRIEELMDREFPITVEFMPTSDKNSMYSPRLGRVRLKRRYSTNIVYGTSYMDDQKLLISFSRELNVHLQIGRVIVVEDEDEYSTIAEPKEERIEEEIVELLLHSNPFTGDYHAGVYESFVETIKQAAMLKNAPLPEQPDFPGKTAQPPVLPRSSRLPGISRGRSCKSGSDASVTDSSNGNETDYILPELQKRDSKDLSKYEAKPPPAVPQRPPKEQVTGKPNDGGKDQNIAKFNDKNQNNDVDDENYETITVKPMSKRNSYVPEPTLPKQTSKQPPEPPPRGMPKLNPKALRKQLSCESKSAPSPKPRQRKAISEGSEAKSIAEDQHKSKAHMMAASHKNVIAFSLPLDAAATFEFKTDVATPQVSTDGKPQAFRPQLPLPIKDEPLLTYETIEDMAKQSEAKEEGEYHYCDPSYTASENAAGPEGGTTVQSTSQNFNDEVFSPSNVDRSHKPPPGTLQKSSMIEATQRKDVGGSKGPPNVKPKPGAFRIGCTAKDRTSAGSTNAMNNPTTPEQERSNLVPMTQKEAAESSMAASSTELKLESGKVSAQEKARKPSEEKTSETTDTQDAIPEPKEKFTHIIEEILDKNVEEIASVLEKLKLESFSEAFKEMQIDGQLIESVEESELVGDFEMSLFQARKLLLYIRGWKPDCESLSETKNSTGNQSNNAGNQEVPETWKEADVYERMKTIKLHSFAEFCVENQVNGELLEKIIDKESIESIKEGHNVKLSRIEERKLYNYVVNRWRPKQ